MRYAMNCCDDEVVKRDGKTFIKYTGPCLGSGKLYSVEVPLEVVEECMGPNRRHIQDMLPDMSPGDREFLISGFSPEGWDEIWGLDEEEDDVDGESEAETSGVRHDQDSIDFPLA